MKKFFKISSRECLDENIEFERPHGSIQFSIDAEKVDEFWNKYHVFIEKLIRESKENEKKI